MNTRIKTGIAFISRSMLWSLLLYVVMMLAINWDEVRYAVNKTSGVTVTQQACAGTPEITPTNISTRATNLSGFLSALKVIIRLK